MKYSLQTSSINGPTKERLLKYVSLLEKWRNVTNLISERSFDNIWERHILDSVELQRQVPNALIWLDIGSGAGIPSVIVASLLADLTNAQVHCVEIDRRKCTFLREVASQIEIPLKIHNTLAENLSELGILGVEVVTARAFSSIRQILKVADPLLVSGATVLLPRGRQAPDEVALLDHNMYMIDMKPNALPSDGFFVRIERRVTQS